MTILNNRFSDKLDIFESFQIDRNLPKYATMSNQDIRNINNGTGRNQNTSVNGGGASVFAMTTPTSTNTLTTTGSTYVQYTTSNSAPTNIVGSSVSYPEAEPDQGVTDEDVVVTINQYFEYIRHSGSMLSNLRYRRRLKAVMSLIAQAEETGQLSLKDLSAHELDRIKMEAILCSKGFKVYVEEKYLVNGFRHLAPGDKDLMELEWISDFNRIIPPKIIARKNKADKLCVFDHYAILHVRPNWYGKKEDRMSDKDTDKLKDPILFGVMNCSRRLYYVGDWVDMQCMLTLAELLDKFGDDAININKDFSRTNPMLPFKKNPLIPVLKKDS